MSYLKSLTGEVREMWSLVLSQHEKTLTALTLFDKDLAREIILIEERVNSCEQFIESDCQHYFSLKNSHDIDVPFAMFELKTTRFLEILGDLAKKMANEVLIMPSLYSHQLFQKANLSEPIRTSNKIIELTLHAFDQLDPLITQVALSRIEICRQMISDANAFLAGYLRDHVQQTIDTLNLFSVLESMKRTLEVSENICHNIIRFNQVATAKA